MQDVIKMIEEATDEFDNTMTICDYAKGLSKLQFNTLMSMLFDIYAREHNDYNLLDNSAQIISATYFVLGRDPHDDEPIYHDTDNGAVYHKRH